MSQNEIVRFALNNHWLEKQAVPDMNAVAAITARKTAKPNRMDAVKAVRRVVWDPGANYSRGPDCASC